MKPKLQIALDTLTLEDALALLQKVHSQIDVIECGTILIINEGLRAVREIRALFPEKPILADVRIAEAGSPISRNCFESGASWVSCVAGASLMTIAQVVKVAEAFSGEVQVELAEEHYTLEKARKWADLGVKHAIVKRSRDLEAAGNLTWGSHDFERIAQLKELGFTVTITGGISVADLEVFSGQNPDIIIAGRAIAQAEDPLEAATALQTKIAQVWR
ncbi:orotidine 5'-phosphate decarboxylase / HUMPS family protein [Trueperella pyogenes]|uniref:orotidine 5'-phosphate decarboxylase / HUMPS family protein n=1 Tax=Trueperella pyogenes TaxID=1661 RepID=UPI00312BB3BF